MDYTMVRYDTMHKTIKDLYDQRHTMFAYPPYQRKPKAWGLRFKAMYIGAHLHGYPTNALTMMVDETVDGKLCYQVIDGVQRISTIISFLENGFRTMTEREANARMLTRPPVAPGCRFSELPKYLQNRLLNTKIVINTFAKQDEAIVEEIFLGYNNQVPLTIGEKLFVRNGLARKIGLSLLEHPLWRGNSWGDLHRETYTSVISQMAIELLGFPLNLKVHTEERGPIAQMILGDHDSALTDTFKNTLWKHLTEMAHLFEGSTIQSVSDAITRYEAILTLDTYAIDCLASPKGCLVPWLYQSRRTIFHERPSVTPNADSRMTYKNAQERFWERETERLLAVPNLLPRSVTQPPYPMS